MLFIRLFSKHCILVDEKKKTKCKSECLVALFYGDYWNQWLTKMERILTTVIPKYGGFQIREDDCSYAWKVETDKRCQWVKDEKNCASDSVFQYTQLLFCNFNGDFLFALGLFILVLWLLYLFLILGTTADNFFCPSLSVIADVLHLSENIAGVTILAFGNGAPDIFTSLVSNEHEMIIMFTELIGAGIFVTAIIAGSVAIVSPFRVPINSVIRDCAFYIIAVCWICYTSEDEIIHLWESLSLILIYVFFLIVVIVMQFYENREEMQKGRIPHLQDPELLRTYVAYRTTEGNRSDVDPGTGLAIRTRAYSLQAKIDVAIATELAMRKRKNMVTDDDSKSHRSNEAEDSSSSSRRPTGLFREFFYDINPINPHEWKDASIFIKTILVLRAPPTFILQCLVPVVNETAENRGWSKLLNCLQLLLTPIFALFKLEAWKGDVGPVPILLLTFFLGGIVAIFVFIKTDVGKCPKYHNAYAFLGFASAMLVVYFIANEVMAVLECIGYASGITEAMLGITLLAWGNSVGDLISNVTVARRGFPRMGYAACFGGPLFNTLIGLGLSWSISAIRSGNYRTKVRPSDMMPGCLAFLLASLVSSIVYLNIAGFIARRSYGYLLWSIYSIFLLINILSEVHFIHPLGTDHRDD